LASWADLEVMEAAVHHDADRWSDDSGQWADAVLVARKTPANGWRGRVSEVKREVLRAVGAFNAGRRFDDAQRTSDDLFASDQAGGRGKDPSS
jgi:hypothetical protein